MLFSLILTCCVLATGATVQIEPVADSVPMLFTSISNAMTTYDTARLIYYINMTEYFKLPQVARMTIMSVEGYCNQLNDPQNPCSIQLDHLKAQLDNARRDDHEIKAQRKPRGICDICGTAFHYAFGVMDAKRARKYADAINDLSEEQKMQHVLLENSTTLFQLYLKKEQKSDNQIRLSIVELEKNLNNVKNDVDRLSQIGPKQNILNALVQLAQTELDEHFQLFLHIRGALGNVKDHRIPDFIPLNQLAKDVMNIAANLKEGQRLPVEILKEDPLHVFEHASISSMLIENLLLTEVMIPITDREEYTLYKATPIPIQTPSGRLIATIPNQYFLLNSMQTELIPLSKRELSHGKKMVANTYLFRPSATVQLKYDNVCAWKILMENSLESALAACNFVPLVENDIIIPIIENESYFMATKTTTKLWEVCDQKTNNVIQLEGRNIIRLGPECSVKSSSFIIRQHRTFTFNDTTVIVPSMPSSSNTMQKIFDLAQMKSTPISMPMHDQIFVQTDDELENIIQQSDALATAAKHKIKTEKLVYDSKIHSFLFTVVIFVIVLIVISIIIFIAYKKFSIFGTVLNAIGLLNNGRVPEIIKAGLNDVERQVVPRRRHAPATPFPRRQIANENHDEEDFDQ